MTDTIAGATRHSHIHDGLKLSYLDSAPGDTTRPAVLLLHGFPDEATVWAPQIPVLAISQSSATIYATPP